MEKKCVYNYWALLCCRHCMKYLIYNDPTNYLLFILREFMLRESKWLVHGHIVCKWQRPSLPKSNNPALNLSTLPHKGTEFGHLTKPKWLFYGHQCFLSHCWDKSQWTIWNILFSIQLFPFYLTISQCVSNCKHLWIIYLSFISSQISTSFGIFYWFVVPTLSTFSSKQFWGDELSPHPTGWGLYWMPSYPILDSSQLLVLQGYLHLKVE